MLVRGLQVAGAFARDPLEAFERARDQLSERRDLRTAVPAYVPDEHWVATLRDELGARSGGGEDAEFDQVWQELEDRFAQLHLQLGRATFGGWDDGDPALARATWSVVRRLRPSVVVETGVGRGVTTRVILQALTRNGHGHLWSIDVPPLLERGLADETAAVVPASETDRSSDWISRTTRRTVVAPVEDVCCAVLFRTEPPAVFLISSMRSVASAALTLPSATCPARSCSSCTRWTTAGLPIFAR